MNILVTGSKEFIGKNLVATLKNIRDLKDKTRPNIKIENVFEYDIDSTSESLNGWIKNELYKDFKIYFSETINIAINAYIRYFNTQTRLLVKYKNHVQYRTELEFN